MHKHRALITVTAFGCAMSLLLGVQAIAGEADKKPHVKEADKKAAGKFTPELQRATKLRGMPVTNHLGQDLGKLEHLAVDTRRNQVVYGIISRGGILEIGDKETAVPWQLFRGSAESDRLIVFTDKKTLKKSAELSDERIADLGDKQWAIKVHDHYRVKPYWMTSRASFGENPWREREKDTVRKSADQAERMKQKRAVAAQRQDIQASISEDPDFGTHGQVVLAKKLIGSTVRNPEDQELGKLADLMVDIRSGQIGYAILARGGVIGIGETMHAVPMDRFSFLATDDKEQPNVLARLSRTELEDAPSFKDKWPDVTSSAWNREVNDYYGSQPYYVVYGFVLEPDQSGMRDWAHEQEVAFRGTIQGIDHEATGLGLDLPGVQIQLRIEEDMTALRPDTSDRGEGVESPMLQGRTVTVNLAPAAFLKQQDCELSRNDQVTIRGFHTPGEAEQPVIVARTIQKGGTTVMLRRSDGQPMWTGAVPKAPGD